MGLQTEGAVRVKGDQAVKKLNSAGIVREVVGLNEDSLVEALARLRVLGLLGGEVLVALCCQPVHLSLPELVGFPVFRIGVRATASRPCQNAEDDGEKNGECPNDPPSILRFLPFLPVLRS